MPPLSRGGAPSLSRDGGVKNGLGATCQLIPKVIVRRGTNTLRTNR